MSESYTDRLSRLRHSHLPVEYRASGEKRLKCADCNTPWPCNITFLLDEVDRLTQDLVGVLRNDHKCICPHFTDTGDFRIGDLSCPVHGVEGTKPLDEVGYEGYEATVTRLADLDDEDWVPAEEVHRTHPDQDPCIHGPGVLNCGHPDCVGAKFMYKEK